MVAERSSASSPISETIGVIGLGQIGLPIALNLSRGGFDVVGWDVSVPMQETASRAGIRIASSARNLSKGADIVSVVLPGDQEIENLLYNPVTGIANDLDDGSVLIVHSTATIGCILRVAEFVKGRDIEFIEAPISGGPGAAKDGTLTVIMGSNVPASERVMSVVDELASNVHVCRKYGEATLIKLANQTVSFATWLALSETCRIAESWDVDINLLRNIIDDCTAKSYMVRNFEGLGALSAKYDEVGTARSNRPWNKDVRSILSAAFNHDVRVPFTSLIVELMDSELGGFESRQ